jgi:hypothetical protein
MNTVTGTALAAPIVAAAPVASPVTASPLPCKICSGTGKSIIFHCGKTLVNGGGAIFSNGIMVDAYAAEVTIAIPAVV